MRGVQTLSSARFRAARAPNSCKQWHSSSRRCVQRHAAQSTELAIHTIQAQPISTTEFEPFGQYIEPIDDMKAFDAEDAQLNLANGTPRFYIMRLPLKPAGLQFTQITHHKEVTQCLGSLTPEDWYMAVAKPGIETLTPEDVSVFKVPFGAFIKMHAGTWHAGPHFEEIEHMDFYNLELCDTNQVDHYNFYFDQEMGTALKIIPC